MRHSPDICDRVDCQECTDLVNSGLVYGCDDCGKSLHSDQLDYIYDEDTGKHTCLGCLEAKRARKSNDCYSRLVSIYIEHGAEMILSLHYYLDCDYKDHVNDGTSACDLFKDLLSEFTNGPLRVQINKLIQTLQLENGDSVKQNTPGETQFI